MVFTVFRHYIMNAEKLQVWPGNKRGFWALPGLTSLLNRMYLVFFCYGLTGVPSGSLENSQQ